MLNVSIFNPNKYIPNICLVSKLMDKVAVTYNNVLMSFAKIYPCRMKIKKIRIGKIINN